MSGIGTYIIGRDKDFLTFYKDRYPLYHLSNVFFRDLHYGVMAYLQKNQVKASYPDAEEATLRLAEHYEAEKIFRRIDDRTWLLQYPDFKAVPKPKPDVPAKPAPRPAPAAAPKPAGGAPASVPSTDVQQGTTESGTEKKHEASPSQS